MRGASRSSATRSTTSCRSGIETTRAGVRVSRTGGRQARCLRRMARAAASPRGSSDGGAAPLRCERASSMELTGPPPLRVGRISYLNVEPFFHAFPWPLADALAPRQLGEAVAAGRLDAGPLPLADVIRLEADVAVLPFGIATRDRAQSVFLFADRPMAELGGARIAVT